MSVHRDEITIKRNMGLLNKFKKALYSSSDCSSAQEYLEKRKITKDLIEKFDLGWCPSTANFPDNLKYLSNLKGRIIFPVKNEFGDLVSFSGRLPSLEKTEEVKWWHESYAKSFFLYGMDLAYEEILKKNHVFIVEGQVDVIMCHKHGMLNTVGSMGTALTFQHISKINRLTNNYVLMFDGDSAGRTAASETKKYFDKFKDSTCENIQYKYIDVNLNLDGHGYDPDEMLNKYGIKFLRKIVNKAKKDNNNGVG